MKIVEKGYKKSQSYKNKFDFQTIQKELFILIC